MCDPKILAEILVALKQEVAFSTPRDSRDMAADFLIKWFEVHWIPPVTIPGHWSDEAPALPGAK